MANKTIYLHIGAYKTATTYVQTMLYKNRKSLRKFGIDYPDESLGLQSENNFYAHRLLGLDFESYGVGTFERQWKRLCEDDSLTSLLFSYEGLHRPDIAYKFYQQRDRLKDVRFKVIFYVRSFLPLSLSMYREACQNLDFIDPYSTFIVAALQGGAKNNVWPGVLNYKLALDLWRAIAGPENVIVKNFEQDKKTIVPSLLRELSYTGLIKEEENSIVNPSLSAVTAEFMRLAKASNLNVHETRKLTPIMQELDREIPDLKSIAEVPEDVARQIYDGFAPAQAALEQAYPGVTEGWDFKWNYVSDLSNDKIIGAAKLKLADLAKDPRYHSIIPLLAPIF